MSERTPEGTPHGWGPSGDGDDRRIPDLDFFSATPTGVPAPVQASVPPQASVPVQEPDEAGTSAPAEACDQEWEPIPSRPAGPPPRAAVFSRRRRTAGAAGAAGVAGVTKAGTLGKLLLALKSLAFLAKLKVAASMLLSIGSYALVWGWRFAVGFVVLLYLHEMGHVVALRQQGIPASAPVFIPFVGAAVIMKAMPRSAVSEAVVALAGPLAGTTAAYACLQVAELEGSVLMRALAYSGFFLNLINLLPMLPLDGGRVAAALHPALWAVGLVGALVLVWHFPNPVLILMIVLGGLEAYRRWQGRDARGTYYRVPGSTRGLIALAYLGVAAWCVWGMQVTYVVHPGA